MIHLRNHPQAELSAVMTVTCVAISILFVTVSVFAQPNDKDGTRFGSGGTGEQERVGPNSP